VISVMSHRGLKERDDYPHRRIAIGTCGLVIQSDYTVKKSRLALELTPADTPTAD